MIRITKARKEFCEQPVFSWKLEGDERQAYYELMIFDRAEQMIWDSGQVVGCDRHNVICDAKLKKEEKYHWWLVVTGSAGSMDRVEGEVFLTGISEWKQLWVEPDRERKPLTDSTKPVEPVSRREQDADGLEKLDPAVYLRKVVELDQVPEFALAYVTAHGIYALYINGVCVSDLLAPGYTSYGKRLEYQVYDISPYLNRGENVIGMILADGWYTGKIGAIGIGQQFGTESACLCQIMGKYADGQTMYFGSDGEMKWSEGAIRYADLYVGEYYDSRRELTGWLSAGYDDAAWQSVRICNYGYHILMMQGIPGVREVRTIQPEIRITPSAELLLDAGENIVGYVSFQLELKQGDVISLEHSETVDKEGNYLQNIIGQNKNQTDYYVCATDGTCSYKPRFSYHGFRYVRVTGTRDRNPDHYRIHVIATPLADTGTFSCSDNRLNILHQNILRSQQGNMICIPTDCPQRERTGWTGDIQIFAPTGCYEQDIEHFLRHWLEDMEREQLPDGQIPHIVPYMPSHDVMKPPGIEGVSAAGWSDAAIIVPWHLYQFYGDEQILKDHFRMIRHYLESTEKIAAEMPRNAASLDEKAKKRQQYLLNTGFQYGDWLMPSIQMSGRSIFEVVQETGYVIATLQYALITDIMAKICHVLKRKEMEEHYRILNQRIRTAWFEEYMNPDGTCKKDYQGVYVLALAVDAIPDSYRKRVVERLVWKIHENKERLDTGFLSVPYLLSVLQSNGRKDIAHMLLFQDQCPSWLYEVKMGATTMWEYWNGYEEDGTPGDCSMNHFAFGCVGAYLYESVLGIQKAQPGFQKVRICPDIDCGLTWAKGSYDSIWGEISVCWKRGNVQVSLEVSLPPDVEAEIVLGEETFYLSGGKDTYIIMKEEV